MSGVRRIWPAFGTGMVSIGLSTTAPGASEKSQTWISSSFVKYARPSITAKELPAAFVFTLAVALERESTLRTPFLKP